MITKKAAFKMGRQLGKSDAVVVAAIKFFQKGQVEKDKISKVVDEMNRIKKMGRVKIPGGVLPAIRGLFEKKISTPKDITVRGHGNYKLKGKTTGRAYRCRMEGCPGYRIMVKWEDGHITYPCSKGMSLSKKGWRIL